MKPPARPASQPAASGAVVAGHLRAEAEQLRAANEQPMQAMDAHAVVDQAIGVLGVLGPIAPADGFTVLRVAVEVS
ncbi:hypothetical protein [Streptomyces sp. NPDC090083]|uniref:hypothetical protein n=1 Tax=Streptomyces sp. NPDC090083 TaxID=3365941 RepID=UPI00381D56DD